MYRERTGGQLPPNFQPNEREREEAEGNQLQEPTAEHLVQYKAGLSSGACELKIGIN